MMDIKDYWNEENELYEQLSGIIKLKPNTLAYYAREIGISTPTLISFFKGKRIDFSNWCKILNYVQSYKENDGIHV
jgi:predicted transcriptional regulator